MKIVRYLLQRDKKAGLPLPPHGFSSKSTVYGDPPPSRRFDCEMLIAANAARSISHAWMMLQESGLSYQELIRQYKARRRGSRLKRAIHRMKVLIWGD
jgi:hypothetical protein